MSTRMLAALRNIQEQRHINILMCSVCVWAVEGIKEKEGTVISFGDLAVWCMHSSQRVCMNAYEYLCVCRLGGLLIVSALPIMEEKTVKYEILII